MIKKISLLIIFIVLMPFMIHQLENSTLDVRDIDSLFSDYYVSNKFCEENLIEH